MSYSIEDREELEKLEELVSLESKVKLVSLQGKLGKQNFHEELKKVFEPVIKFIKDVSEEVTKTITETSNYNNKAIEKLNNKLQGKKNDRGKLESYLMSLLSTFTNPENTNQFLLVKNFNSNRVNDL